MKKQYIELASYLLVGTVISAAVVVPNMLGFMKYRKAGSNEHVEDCPVDDVEV